jgi:ATP phosphoribosyltransferase regulatory subunit
MPTSQDNNAARGLLPSGLSDLLDPQAAQDAAAIEAVLASFAQFGYRRVKPPLMEFEETLLHEGPGAALAAKSFRLMDPVSHRMMALRADMTAQIARISGTRMAHLPRPLRLAYAGEVMRVVPDVLNPERQLVQAGAELIGRDDTAAIAEILVLGVRALQQAGIRQLTVDIGVPRLFDLLVEASKTALPEACARAVRERDADALAAMQHPSAKLLVQLVQAGGRDPARLASLAEALPEKPAGQLKDMLAVAARLQEAYPDLPITLDPLEGRGFDYHTGVAFSIFAEGLRGEVARGGAYITGYDEVASGLSIYMERLLRGLPEPEPAVLVYLPSDIPLSTALGYAERGRQLVLGQHPAGSKQARAEASQTGCQFIVASIEGTPEALD